jgi:hypothetical protein
MKTAIITSIFALMILFSGASARAEEARPPRQPASTHASDIGKLCPGKWEDASCLAAVSQSNYDLTLGYADALAKAPQAVESLKQHCAAATVIDSNIPAYAYKSAYTECANGIYDISENTGVSPDTSHYQLLVGAVLCLSKDARCAGIESQLK